ncbi:MAG: TatD family deoxyribonuclease [Sphingomonadales bacterium]|nr:TatD family deoxyribonuclease [Sphingomonadales bacterium]
MFFIDTHAHLYLSDFEQDRSAMLEAAQKAGVEQILLPAIDSETHAALVAMEEQFAQCRAMMGVHPCSVKTDHQSELSIARDWWSQRDFIAVGEIGLDFYWDKTFVDQQYEAFRVQIEWALEKKVPVVIHSRNACLECVQVIKEYKGRGLTGVFHCFSGSAEEAREIIKLGFYLGIGGVLTYKNAGLGAVLADVPLQHIILETDAPYLTPVPFRGKRNESSYVRLVAEKLAEVKTITIEQVAQVTTQNAHALFNL